DDAVAGRVLDDIARHCGIRLYGDADAGAVAGLLGGRALRQHVAENVALHDGHASAFVEVAGDRADRADIDGVVGDHRALEGEFGIDGDLANIGHAVADDLDIRRRVAANTGEVAIADAVAADDDVGSAKSVDGVAVLTRAAGTGNNVLDAI